MMNDICACPICFLPYDHVTPVVSTCGHTLCESCSRMIVRNGHFQCPVCERASPFPLFKNMELINLLEFLQLQLDVPTTKQIVTIEFNEISTSTDLSDMLLEEEGIVLTNALLKGNSVIMKKCIYSDSTLYSKEIAMLKDLCHPNLMQLLAYDPSTGVEGGCDSNQVLVYEHAPMGKLSTYLSSSKSASIHSLLSKERRLKIAIDVVHAILYLKSQRSAAYMITDQLSKQIESRYILLDENYTAKLMVMMPHNYKAVTGNLTRLQAMAIANTSTTSTDTTKCTEDLLFYDNDNTDDGDDGDDGDDVQVTKALGYLLLELLLNKEQTGVQATSYPDLISKPMSGDVFFEAIDAADLGHSSIQQYCTEGLSGCVDKAFELFVKPMYNLAMACVDVHRHNISPMSTRHVLFKLRYIRKSLLAAMAPPVPPVPVVEEPKPAAKKTATKTPKASNNTSMTRKEKKASAAAKKAASSASSSSVRQNRHSPESDKESKEHSEQEQLVSKLKKTRKTVSAAASPSSGNPPTTATLLNEDKIVNVTPDPSSVRNNKKVRKKSHHPGYYYNKASTRPSDGVEVPASWRCCGKTSAKAMGCVYGPVSHHTGKWICSIESISSDVVNNDEKEDKKWARGRKLKSQEANGERDSSAVSVKWGSFDCCTVDSHDGENKSLNQVDDQVVDQPKPLSSHAGCQQGPQPTPIRGAKSSHT